MKGSRVLGCWGRAWSEPPGPSNVVSLLVFLICFFGLDIWHSDIEANRELHWKVHAGMAFRTTAVSCCARGFSACSMQCTWVGMLRYYTGTLAHPSRPNKSASVSYRLAIFPLADLAPLSGVGQDEEHQPTSMLLGPLAKAAQIPSACQSFGLF